MDSDTLGRATKRKGSCTQNAVEEYNCSDSYRLRHCDLLGYVSFPQNNDATRFYCAFTQLSDPVNLTDTSEKKSRSGFPSAVPR